MKLHVGSSKLKDFTKSLNMHMVECSQALQKLQYKKLECMDEDGDSKNVDNQIISALTGSSVSWHTTLEQVPTGVPTIIIAHEFYDALPVHQFQVHVIIFFLLLQNQYYTTATDCHKHFLSKNCYIILVMDLSVVT